MIRAHFHHPDPMFIKKKKKKDDDDRREKSVVSWLPRPRPCVWLALCLLTSQPDWLNQWCQWWWMEFVRLHILSKWLLLLSLLSKLLSVVLEMSSVYQLEQLCTGETHAVECSMALRVSSMGSRESRAPACREAARCLIVATWGEGLTALQVMPGSSSEPQLTPKHRA